MKEICCPICRHKQELKEGDLVAYPTQSPLFKRCQLFSCPACKSRWVLNPPSEAELKKYYDAGDHGWSAKLGVLEKPVLTVERGQSLARWRFILKALASSGRTPGGRKISVCDIGAGYGTTLEVGRHLGLDIDFWAYESSKGLRKRIQGLNGKVFDDFFSHPSNEQFDLVWASHILEHYPDPDLLLGRIRLRMRPGGAGFIEIPFRDDEFKPDCSPHLLFFTPEGLRAALERSGFQVLELQSAGRLRVELKREAAQLFKNGIRKKIKNKFPKPLANLGRFFYHSFRAITAPTPPGVAEDLQRAGLFERWDLEAYGGERNWIRGVFIPK